MTVRRPPESALDPVDRSPLPDSDKAALICRSPIDNTLTFWPSLADAVQASRDLAPCGRYCRGLHAVAAVVDGRIRTQSLRPDPSADIAAAVSGDPDAIARLRATLTNHQEDDR